MRRTLLLGVLAALTACPSAGGDKQVAKPAAALPGNEAKLDLPQIPAKLETTIQYLLL